MPPGRAIAFSSLPALAINGPFGDHCQDCACEVSDVVRSAGTAAGGSAAAVLTAGEQVRLTRNPEAVAIQLDGAHRALFNPLGDGGVTVLNEAAFEVFSAIGERTSLAEALLGWPGREQEALSVVEHLTDRGLIWPGPSAPPSPATGQARAAAGRMLTAWLHVTNDCTLRCPYCYVSKSGEGMDERTAHQAVRAVVASAAAHGYRAVKLKYAGGEASLNWRLIIGMHELARDLTARAGLDLQATLLSNGVALPQALVAALRAEDIRVMISLDGIGELHDAVRPLATGKPTFRLVRRTIGRLIDAGVPPHLSITITGRNAVGLADVVRFALERELTFSFNFFRDNDEAAGQPGLRYDQQTMISCLREAFGVIEQMMPRWSVLGSVLDRGQLLRPLQQCCGVGQDYVVIDQRGRVAQCQMEIGRVLGDVYSDDPVLLVRDSAAPIKSLPVVEKEGCRECTWRYWCSGGCPVATFRATGRWDIKSPNCSIYQAIFPEALRLEGLRLLRYHRP